MKKLKLDIQKSIITKKLIQFFYKDKSKDKSGIRIIEPYLFGVDKKGNYFVSGYDINDLSNYPHKNYLIQQMDISSFKILKNVFTHLRIEPYKIYKTKETIIICIADFPEIIKKHLKDFLPVKNK